MKGNDRQFGLITLPNVVCNHLPFVRPRIRIILLYISRCFTAVLVRSVDGLILGFKKDFAYVGSVETFIPSE